jgi:hypothetical protein
LLALVLALEFFCQSVSWMDLERDRLWGWEVDGTGSISCPMEGFGVSGVDLLDSATTALVGQSDRP